MNESIQTYLFIKSFCFWFDISLAKCMKFDSIALISCSAPFTWSSLALMTPDWYASFNCPIFLLLNFLNFSNVSFIVICALLARFIRVSLVTLGTGTYILVPSCWGFKFIVFLLCRAWIMIFVAWGIAEESMIILFGSALEISAISRRGYVSPSNSTWISSIAEADLTKKYWYYLIKYGYLNFHCHTSGCLCISISWYFYFC